MMLKANRVRPTPELQPASHRFLKALDNGLARVVLATEEDHAAARMIVNRHRDKGYSLCDALSFAVMERLGITHAASFDHHFRQYGRFVVLP
jgi:uncharacterized protein